MSLRAPPKLTFTKDAQYEWRSRRNKGRDLDPTDANVAPMHVSNTDLTSRAWASTTASKFHR